MEAKIEMPTHEEAAMVMKRIRNVPLSDRWKRPFPSSMDSHSPRRT